MNIPSKAAMKALRIAAGRERRNICPTRGVHAAAQQMLLDSLIRNGWAEMDGPSPRITDAGIIMANGEAP